ncbi:2-hydroxychromene-2-carboxylate isomerase [Rhizobium sp. C4]|uniref:2-hydroxychromene-2-carboxylate isomerase n=1 Tax=Rhizobium sp. C4 TaxID=1349800 RepID=UPI001E5F77BA|nr:2-hydroxychromene-2-carboxylate isomerase [Rhizobium sp. C4]MCD2172996.1 2-hydroxychromene-2-carboxylate isomerase [Rhizobium sp. C4]
MKQVEFFFDVGSPFSHIAWRALPEIAARNGAEIVWRPILIGGIFKATGNSSPATVPAKWDYSSIDLYRWADYYRIPFQMNPHFPINTLPLMRGATAMLLRGPKQLEAYLDAIYPAMFEQPVNLGDVQEIGKVLARAGIDPQALMAEIGTDAVKDKLRTDTDEAVQRGVFGAPTFFVGKDMFWGQDRLMFVERALKG